MRKKLIDKFLRSYFHFHRTIDASCDCPVQSRRLNKAQIELLYNLHNKKAMSIGEIAKSCSVTSSAATQLVEGMEKCGFVARSEDKQDRRVVKISLSRKGQAFYKSFHVKHIETLDKLLTGVSVDELQTMVRIQDKIHKNLAKERA